jgi:1,4-dihydroxy-2-naphthoyl-CoA synthase
MLSHLAQVGAKMCSKAILLWGINHVGLNANAVLAVQEMSWCFADARDDPQTGVIVLTGRSKARGRAASVDWVVAIAVAQ